GLEEGDGLGRGYRIVQPPESFRPQLDTQPGHAGHVAARAIPIGHQAERDRVTAGLEDNRNDRGHSFGGDSCGGARRGDHEDLSAHQIGGHPGQLIVPTLRPPVFDLDVMVLDVTGSPKPLPNSEQRAPLRLDRTAIDKPDHRHRSLLRPRRERPRGGSAAEQRYELAPPHSITSSARASSVDGTSRPSTFAVLRLITNSYLVGACTGRSAGFSPLRMRST